ncbi:nuclear transport factor 2 family protein [Winogradskyella sp. A3E31]|uniref:nuclear transport factor 2 family protein n=1 Tax=Winogradskyella sp. A3E31 TaxID=3349637 RepID=UPI00398B901C
MNKITLTSISIIFAFNSIFGQTNEEKYAKDVKSIDAIINAYYDVVSGSSSDPWEFERDKYIHSENAVITRLDENGKTESHTLEAEYIPIGLSPKEDFYEKELKRRVSKFGNIAQVWSAFEIRTDPKTESNSKGLNSIQLHYENGRWWIDSWTCEMESKKNAVVTEFMTNDDLNTSSAVAEIKKMEQLQVQGILEKDSTIIRKILAKDLVVNAPSNTVVDLNIAMDALKLGYIDYTSYEQKIDEIRIIENIGIVMGLETVMPTGLTGKVGTTEKRRFTDIWMYKNNQWIMIARQATNISIE